MPDYDPKTDIHVTSGPPSGGGGLYFIVGALVVAVLVGAYFMFGAPGLHSNVARAPDRNFNVTVSPSGKSVFITRLARPAFHSAVEGAYRLTQRRSPDS